MPKLGKQTIAQTFKFDCDRFLRFQLSSDTEKKTLGIEEFALGKVRPGVQLMQEAGNKWEIDKYNDLILGFGKDNVKYIEEEKIDPILGVKKFKVIKDLKDILNLENPPKAIIEAEFKILESVSIELKLACDKFDIEPSRAIPDIIWIKPHEKESPLILEEGDLEPEYELHIIDVKMASEASLKHFTEVTFYALALDAFLRDNNLIARYRVSAKGLVWPGSHDINEFKNIVRKFQANNELNPVVKALEETLIPVPYEVYEIHIKRFFKERLIPVLEKSPKDAAWHISAKCQLCQYLTYCQGEAKRDDQLCKIPWLNSSQANLIRSEGILNTSDLRQNILQNTPAWEKIKSVNYQLRADESGIEARCNSLEDGVPYILSERVSHLMPKWSDMSIFLTLHFDPGSGITFAIGAKKVYFKPGRSQGEPPISVEKIFIIDKVEQFSPATERNRLIELINLLESWLNEVNDDNNIIAAQHRANTGRDNAFGKSNVHFFFWSKIEVKQFLRMVERHMDHPDVVAKVEIITRLFPPDNTLPLDLDMYKSQPGTVVKDVVKYLVALPISYDYTLLETANKFFPKSKPDGSLFQFYFAYGFWTPLNDQIPFERAYELWKDNVFLKHSQNLGGLHYTRDEIYEGLRRSVKTYLEALQNIVMRLRDNCKNQLVLHKPPFYLGALVKSHLPQVSKNLLVFNKLNILTQEIENLHQVSLPIDEKEARFVAIRGLINKSLEYSKEIEGFRDNNVSLRNSTIYAFEFSINSRDAKLKEGEFLCCLTNEDFPANIYTFWYTAIGLKFEEALSLLNERNINQADRKVKKTIAEILSVTILKLNTISNPPYVLLEIPNYNLDMFNFAIKERIIDLDKPMVLDSSFKDFESKDIEKILRDISNKAPRNKR
ncbi:hypothetical protein [Emticicia soli]|uniref:PD-(D/E)XK endonuclease-like domain-containing protein n=1 Tax=Emticicia soli TaxID=2027878 RepID=A0ABW5JDF0_9BACT